MSDNETTKIRVEIPTHLHRQMVIAKAIRSTSTKAFVEAAIRRHVEDTLFAKLAEQGNSEG